MNMKKLLATGLVASVAVTAAQAEACRDGGFYVGVNFGANFGKCKYTNDIEDQEGVLDESILTTKKKAQNVDATQGHEADKGLYYKLDYVKASKKDVSAFSASKSKTRFLGEFVVGYDFRIGDVMLGVDVAFGSTFGKVKKESAKGIALRNDYQKAASVTASALVVAADAYTQGNWTASDEYEQPGDNNVVKVTDIEKLNRYNETSVATVRFKNKFGFSIMPRVGYLITPDFEIFATAGVKIRSDKVTVTTKENEDAEEKSYTKSKTKCAPAFGLGVNYAITPEIYAKLEYNYICKSKISKKDDLEITHKAEVKGQEIKLGIGYRF